MPDDYNDDGTADQAGDEITLSDLNDLQSDDVTGNDEIPEVVDDFLSVFLKDNYEEEMANFLAAFARLDDGEALGYEAGELNGVEVASPSDVATNASDIDALEAQLTDDGTSYEIQKNGTDGAGIINFKTE